MQIPDINQRVRQIIDLQTGGNVKKFAESINIKQQSINRLFNIDTRTGKYPIVTTEILVAITEMYVDVDSKWLLTGKADAYQIEKNLSKVASPSTEYSKNEKNDNFIIEELKKQNSNQRNDIEWFKKELDKKQEMIDALLSGSVTIKK
jgi:hypothetical protein